MDATDSSSCPRCGADRTQIVEDVSDEVTVFGCPECDTTWAERADT